MFRSYPPLLHVLEWLVLFISSLHVFTFLIPCCDVRYDFYIKMIFGRNFFICLVSCFINVISVYLRIRSLCEMMFVSFNSNITGVTYGTGTAIPSGAPEFTSEFCEVRVARSLVIYVVFCSYCISFCLFLLVIVFSALLRFSASDYYFGLWYLQTLLKTEVTILPTQQNKH